MESSLTAAKVLKPKSHYEVLDGLRGVAAFMVVAFHTCEANAGGNRFRQVINHGYLAVDFFFLLSGFVVAYAYDDRWHRMSQWDFYKRRLIRLQPMVIMGSLIGAALFYLGRGQTFPLVAQTPVWKMLLVMLVGFTMIPLTPGLDVRGWNEMHPLNGPAWSLFFEYVANILYALGLRKLSNRWLGILALLSAALLVHLAVTGEGDFIGGWAINVPELHIGFTRLLYPFLAGMLLMRSGLRLYVPHKFLVCSLILVLCLALPRFGGPHHLWINGLYEAFCILVIFPLVVAIGAGEKPAEEEPTRQLSATTQAPAHLTARFTTQPTAQLTAQPTAQLLFRAPARGPADRLCRFFGDVSYPLYITHYPLIYAYTAWVERGGHPLGQRIGLGVLLFCTAVTVAYACLKLYDEPVRAWLTRRYLHPATPQTPTHIPGTDPAFTST